MENPLDPSEEELRAWASDATALWPMQDWDIVLSDSIDPMLMIDLAADDSPGASFFLHCLYIRVGDEVRGSRPKSVTRAAIEAGGRHSSDRIVTWAQRSSTLIGRPELFDYEQWCDGGLAAHQLRWP